MNERQLIYQNGRIEEALTELPGVLERHTLLCSPDNPVPGLPCFDARDARSRYDRERREHVYDTPWGVATLAYNRDLGARRLHAITPLYRLCDGADDAPLQRAPEPGRAVVDTLTGVVSVYRGAVDTAETEESALEEAVYDTRVRLDGKTGQQVLQQVWAGLARAGVPVCPMELYGYASSPYPWEEDGGFRVPHVANDEVSAPLVGYAVDPETDEVVYLHVAGHKTTLRSIWGTLSNGGAQSVSIGAGRRRCFAYSSHNYDTFSDHLERDTNLYRLIVTDRRAIDREAEGRAYLVVPRAKTGLDLGTVFAARLNALLPIPVLPQWGQSLYGRGMREQELLSLCPHGGDVEKAFAIGEEGWLELIQDLVRSGELAVTTE